MIIRKPAVVTLNNKTNNMKIKTIKYQKDNQEFFTELRVSVKRYFETKGIEKYGNKEIFVNF